MVRRGQFGGGQALQAGDGTHQHHRLLAEPEGSGDRLCRAEARRGHDNISRSAVGSSQSVRSRIAGRGQSLELASGRLAQSEEVACHGADDGTVAAPCPPNFRKVSVKVRSATSSVCCAVAAGPQDALPNPFCARSRLT